MRKSSLALLAAAIGLAAGQASAADLPQQGARLYFRVHRLPSLGPVATSAATSAAHSATARATSPDAIGQKSLQTVLALPVAVKSAATISSQAAGCSVSAICTIGRTTKEAEQLQAVCLTADRLVNFNNQWFDTLTGRLGYAVAPTWLFYFQGGAAWAHTSTDFTLGGVQVGQASKTRSGWTVGGGVEWMFAPQWSAFVEGNWMDFGSRDGASTPLQPAALSAPSTQKRPRPLF